MKLIDDVLEKSLPQAQLSRRKMKDTFPDFPTLADSAISNAFATINYESATHLDQSDDLASCSVALWLLRQNGCECLQCQKEVRVSSYFVLPEYKVAIPLDHLCLIIWPAKSVWHGSSLINRSPGCIAQKVAFVTQNKLNLNDRFKNYFI